MFKYFSMAGTVERKRTQLYKTINNFLNKSSYTDLDSDHTISFYDKLLIAIFQFAGNSCQVQWNQPNICFIGEETV